MAISNGRYIHKFKLSFSNGTYWNLHFPMVDIFIFPTIAKFSMCGDFPQKICSRQDDLTSKLFGNVTCPNEALATFITTGMVNHCCSTIVSPPNLFVQSGCQLQPTSWEPLLSENYSTKLKMSQNLSLETYNSINLYTSLYIFILSLNLYSYSFSMFLFISSQAHGIPMDPNGSQVRVESAHGCRGALRALPGALGRRRRRRRPAAGGAAAGDAALDRRLGMSPSQQPGTNRSRL